jgi:hypothetical protein
MKIQCVSYYTPDYQDDVEGLIATAAEFNIDIAATRLDQMSWQDAVRTKPLFINAWVEQANQNGDCDGVLWVDADARFRRQPDWDTFEGVDLACSLFQWTPGHIPEMLTGTVYVRATDHMAEFTHLWADATKKVGAQCDTPEGVSLKLVYEQYKDAVAFYDLPIVWTWFDGPAGQKKNKGKRPIIEHLQRSRQRRSKKV